MLALIIPFLLFLSPLSADLMRDLEVASYWDQVMNERVPTYYNHLLYGGYFNMPSARMGPDGEVGFGYASVDPYRLYSVRCQLAERLEFSGNYRVFKGVQDPILSQYGFGDLSDKGANLKIALFKPEDSEYRLPGVAFGMEDFLGTRNFKSKYLVITQVSKKYDFELSIGYGFERIRGFFGGFLWIPFRKWESSYLKGLALATEYDATPYRSKTVEKHPKGREQKSKINLGVKYRVWDSVDLSASWVRGCKFAFSAAVYYNLGHTKGLVPKIDDALPYTAPKNVEPIGCHRTEKMLGFDLAYPFQEQGFELLEVALSYDECNQKRLHLKVFSMSFRTEDRVRDRLNHLMAFLIPSDIHKVIVVIQSEGFPVQEYHYDMNFVRMYAAKTLCEYELEVLTPMREVTFFNAYSKKTFFEKPQYLYNFYVEPKTHTYFGSSKGKFKYSLGVHVGVDGYFWNGIYYSVLLGYNLLGDISDVKDVDRLNPSQIINVRSDVVNYYKNDDVTLDECYLQKNWNMGRGWYSKVAFGYFEEEYAGLAGEVLWYPVEGPFSIGAEAAIFRKRNYKGLGFQSKIRKLHGFVPSYQDFFFSQAFANFYYRWDSARLDFKVSVGKFLANDFGVRYEIARYFPSGLEIYLWYTRTNGNDHINGETYYDKGVGFSMPLDIFYTYSSRERWGYGMSAWLRDVGVKAATGMDLYDTIALERDRSQTSR